MKRTNTPTRATERRPPSWTSKTKRPDTIRAIPVSETTAARLLAFIDTNVDPKAKKFTDENRAYGTLKNHHTACHGKGEHVRGEVHINGTESFWALVRRGYNGTFHRIEPKHLHRYIDEFAGHLCTKTVGTVGKMCRIWGQETYTCLYCGAQHAVWPALTSYFDPNPEWYVIWTNKSDTGIECIIW